jgi:hypothetical protein
MLTREQSLKKIESLYLCMQRICKTCEETKSDLEAHDAEQRAALAEKDKEIERLKTAIARIIMVIRPYDLCVLCKRQPEEGGYCYPSDEAPCKFEYDGGGE